MATHLGSSGKAHSKLAGELAAAVSDYLEPLALPPTDVKGENFRKWLSGNLPNHTALTAILIYMRRHRSSERDVGEMIEAYNFDANQRRHQTPYPWTAQEILAHEREHFRSRISSYFDRTYKFPLGFRARNLAQLSKSGVHLQVLDASFTLAQPAWLEAAIRNAVRRRGEAVGDSERVYASNRVAHDLRDRLPNAQPPSLDRSLAALGFKRTDLNDAIRAEADSVLASWSSNLSKYKVYNRPKLGVLDVDFVDPVDGPERMGARVRLYRTDYFTHRVMHRLLDLFRDKAGGLPIDEQQFPYFAGEHVPHFATSLGLNISLISTAGIWPSVLLSRLGHNNANTESHGRLHVAANEGLNMDDVQSRHGGRAEVNLSTAIRRALKEECQIKLSLIQRITLCELFVTRENAEMGMHVVIHTRESFQEVRRTRLRSRDRGREFKGDLLPIRLSRDSFVGLVPRSPGEEETTSYYLPSLLESLLDD